MERVPRESDMLTCPYDACHHIMRSNMAVHLIRCRRTHTNSDLVTCPFNTTHVLPKVELNFHVTVCENRKNYEHFKHCEAAIDGFSSTEPKSFIKRTNPDKDQQVIVDCDEDWDIEPPTPPYDPQAHCKFKDVIRQPVGMTPAQRVAFRQAERERLRNVRQMRQ